MHNSLFCHQIRRYPIIPDITSFKQILIFEADIHFSNAISTLPAFDHHYSALGSILKEINVQLMFSSEKYI